jgi:glycosyltransferase involved in cell wall biosynthesis
MPVLNAEDFLKQTLETISAQTFTDFELLVVDDGSTDSTPDILAACHDPRLRVLRNQVRQKLSGALNRGLEEARGELVARMDADDLMRRDRLLRQVEHMERYPEIGCCGGWARTFGTGPRKILRFPAGAEQVKAFSLFYTPFAHPTAIFRRVWFEREGMCYDGSYYPTEDYELWSRAIRCFPCDNLPQVLVDYRVHGKSMTGGEWPEMDAQTERVHRRILAQLEIEPSEDESRLHRAASMGLLPAVPGSFPQTETWLLKLEAANGKIAVFDPEALADMLNYVWFRMSMAVVRNMGGKAWELYRQSRLSTCGPYAYKRRWTMRAAALKADLVGRRG